MANVMTTGGSIKCAHTGTATLSSSAKLKVGGTPVLLSDAVGNWPIAGCTQTSSNTQPCLKIDAPLNEKSTKLKVGGVAVVLDSMSGATDGKPTNTFTVTAGQSKLKAV